MSGGLIADIGGTYSRLALADPGAGITAIGVYRNTDYSGIDQILHAYLDTVDASSRPRTAALAVAAPVRDDRAGMTNLGWEFSGSELRSRFGFDACRVLNDFVAIAMAVPTLGPEDVRQIGTGEAVPGQPIAVAGPGTGLGTSALIPYRDSWIPVASEGGHVTLAAATEEEGRIVDRLRDQLGHVSAERLLSGPGLVLLYQLLAGADAAITPEAITSLAADGNDPVATETLDRFLAMLGTVAGNLALTFGAGGGVYLGGGILPQLADRLEASAFRERFMDKGRYRDYLQGIPTFLITHEHPALAGLQHCLDET